MKKFLIIAVLVSVAGRASAQTFALEGLSRDSSISASSSDLGAARELSARLLDGSLVKTAAAPVSMGDIAPAPQAELKYSEVKKLELKGNVPAPRLQKPHREEVKGFGDYMKAAVLAPFVVPYESMMEAAARGAGSSIMTGKSLTRVIVVGTLCAVAGLLVGIVKAPIVMVKNVGSAIASLF